MSETNVEQHPRMNLPISVGAVTEVGQREQNQDNMTGFMSSFGAVYLVADGMGGHKGGAEASRMVADGFRRHLLSLPSSMPVADALSLATRLTNVELLEASKSGDANLTGMGSTVAIALVRGSGDRLELVTAHAGDSRVYLHHAGQLTLLTRDHTQVQRLVDEGLIDEATARTHPDASVLTRAMGHSTDLAIEVSGPFPLADGDGILLCSDGLSGFADSEEINQTILQYPEPAVCANELVHLALRSGSNDNITVQFLRIGKSPQAIGPAARGRKTLPEGTRIPQGVAHPASASEATRIRWSQARLFVAGLVIGLMAAAGGIFAYRSGLFTKTVVTGPVVVASPPAALRLEGSTTLGDELIPAMLEAFLAKEGAKDIEPQKGSGDKKDQMTFLATLPGKPRQSFSIIANGSGNAFNALAAGRADIGMSSRRIKDNEAGNLSKIGDMRSAACEHVVALDGISVVVNPGNPIDSLDKAQVAGIFRGKITDWAKIPRGRSGPIHLYSRNKKSGTFDFFVDAILNGDQTAIAPGATIKDNGEDIAKAVAADPNGIGYVGLAQVASAKTLQLSDGKGSLPQLPSPFTLATDDYLLSRRLYLYIPANATDLARRFVAFAESTAGQSIVTDYKFVEQTAKFEKVPQPRDGPALYLNAISGKERMNINFRFRTNKAEPDENPPADIQRAKAALVELGAHEIWFIGFADKTEKCQADQAQNLPKQRAEFVRKQFADSGFSANALGVCAAAPMGANNNRRVEVWAKR